MFSIYLDVFRVCLIDNQDSGLLINKLVSLLVNCVSHTKMQNSPCQISEFLGNCVLKSVVMFSLSLYDKISNTCQMLAFPGY